jgi:hypothetical protein
MNTKIAGLIAAVAILAVAGVAGFQAVRASGGGAVTDVKAEVQLTFPTDALASGKAKSEQRTGGTPRTRFAIEVEDVSWQPGPYSVRITHAGTPVADSPVTLDVDSFGAGELELDTQDGATVPVAVAGDVVEVLDASSTPIASGALVAK